MFATDPSAVRALAVALALVGAAASERASAQTQVDRLSPAAGEQCAATSSACTEPRVIRTFVALRPGNPAVFYQPVRPRSSTTVFVMHDTVDYLESHACIELSRRGYRVLCENSSTSKAGAANDVDIERVTNEARFGMAWLRAQPGVGKIVLFGHSGGGVLMSLYQAVAEAGLNACQAPEKILPCGDTLAGLPPADGLMLIDANYGSSAMMLFSLDPAVLDERSGKQIDPSLSLWNPANGITPTGAHFSAGFARRWQSAVSKRNNQLIDSALDRWRQIKAGKGTYDEDEPLIIPGASYSHAGNKFFSQDPFYLGRTHGAWPLLHKDGRVTTEVVRSVRRPFDLTQNTSALSGALNTTVRGFLSSDAIRTAADYGFGEDRIHGIDWSSSYTTPVGNIRYVTKPLLAMGMTGSYEFINAEMLYESSRSRDRTVAFVDGASHGFDTCKECEQAPGQYGDTVKTLFDYIARWLDKPGRF